MPGKIGRKLSAAVVLVCGAGLAGGQTALDAVPQITVTAPDVGAVRAEDEAREAAGLPPRFAIPNPVLIDPHVDGTWFDTERDTRTWRLRITSPGALSLNLGFTTYFMPAGGELWLRAVDGGSAVGPFTAADNEEHGELWTPVVLTDDALLEVRLPRAVADELILELTSINVGYRGFGELLGARSGWCNIDVVCPEGADWQDQIKSVGVISTGGSLFCTGFAVNNTAYDRTPYFMTANHCGITSGNAASLVVYWNFQSPSCGQHGGGSLAQHQTGSYFRAAYAASDFTLVQLDDQPAEAFDVVFAGWDRSTADPTSAVAVHHPNCDEKSISFEYQPCTTTSYLGTSVPGDGTHIRVADWDLGTTEPGSSGSPLFNQEGRVVGQLHGGYAACGNDLSDWYGRFSRSWTGGGSNSTRLSNWLDPGNTGLVVIDALSNNEPRGIRVTPDVAFESTGDTGGPFAPASIEYVVENLTDQPLDVAVTAGQPWLTLSSAGGTLAGYATLTVTVTINALAGTLPGGVYTDVVQIVNTTDHFGDASRNVTLHVGIPHLIYQWTLDVNPGWIGEGAWAWGAPTGAGSHFGDPSGGHTGPYVYGYNLNGDYPNNMPARYLRTTAIDCTGLSLIELRFWRWLGVEGADHAVVQVSTDASTWNTVWSAASTVSDSAWSQVAYPLSPYADGQPAVYVRWGLGPTDLSVTYPGWNIDDLELWAVTPPPLTDCNGNGIADAIDISSGASWDDNVNGVPDECERVPGDLNCDGAVSFSDINAFVLLLSDPGAYLNAHPGCLRANGDLNASGTVDFGDINPFVTLLTNG